jgi:hypothetical protein
MALRMVEHHDTRMWSERQWPKYKDTSTYICNPSVYHIHCTIDDREVQQILLSRQDQNATIVRAPYLYKLTKCRLLEINMSNYPF